MDYILCFIAGTFFGTFIAALMGSGRKGEDCFGHMKAIVYRHDYEYDQDEDDDEDYEDGE